MKKLSLPADFVNTYKEVADNIPVTFDPESFLFKQFRGFNNLDHYDFRSLNPGKTGIDAELRKVGLESGTQDVIKQPDVNLLLYLMPEATVVGWIGKNERFKNITAEELHLLYIKTLISNYVYYTFRCSGGSSLTRPIHNLNLLKIHSLLKQIDVHQKAALLKELGIEPLEKILNNEKLLNNEKNAALRNKLKELNLTIFKDMDKSIEDIEYLKTLVMAFTDEHASGRIIAEEISMTLNLDLKNIQQNTAEGLHAATQGGVLQVFHKGFGGIEPIQLNGKEYLSLNPVFPPFAQKTLTIPFTYQGQRIDYTLCSDTGRIIVHRQGRWGRAITLIIEGKEVILKPGETYDSQEPVKKNGRIQTPQNTRPHSGVKAIEKMLKPFPALHRIWSMAPTWIQRALGTMATTLGLKTIEQQPGKFRRFLGFANSV